MSGRPAFGYAGTIARGSKQVRQKRVVQPVCDQAWPVAVHPLTTTLPDNQACSCGYGWSVTRLATVPSASRYTPPRSTIVAPGGAAAIACATVANGLPAVPAAASSPSGATKTASSG